MGNETILYYVTQEAVTGSVDHMKRHFWQKVILPSFVMEKEEMTVIAVIIPSLKKEWKPEKLLKLMQETAKKYSEQFADAQIILHPKAEGLLGGKSRQDGLPPIYWTLSEKLLAGIFNGQDETRSEKGNRKKHRENHPASVVLLMGNLLFPEEQMQKFTEIMQPHLPFINRLFILYSADKDGVSDHLAEFYASGIQKDEEPDPQTERIEEAMQHDTENLYYEYGLVSQIQCGNGFTLKRGAIEIGQSPVFFLDCGYPGDIPYGALRRGDFYLDIVSDEKKESLFRRKYREISYLSPRKYLDTLVKSGYDKQRTSKQA